MVKKWLSPRGAPARHYPAASTAAHPFPTRPERDSFGSIEVPVDHFCGAAQISARSNFAISTERVPRPDSCPCPGQAHCARVNGETECLLPDPTRQQRQPRRPQSSPAATMANSASSVAADQARAPDQRMKDLNEVLKANRASGAARRRARTTGACWKPTTGRPPDQSSERCLPATIRNRRRPRHPPPKLLPTLRRPARDAGRQGGRPASAVDQKLGRARICGTRRRFTLGDRSGHDFAWLESGPGLITQHPARCCIR